MSDFQGCGHAPQSADFPKVHGKVSAEQIKCKFMHEQGLNTA